MVEVLLADESNLEDVRKKKFSIGDTLETVRNAMKTEFKITSIADTRLWVKDHRTVIPKKIRPLEITKETLQRLDCIRTSGLR